MRREADWPPSAGCRWAMVQPFSFVPCPCCLVPLSSGKILTVPSSVPGPCEPEVLIDGIIFAANYLGSTQLLSERNPSKNIRMMQAQEAVSRVKVLVGSAEPWFTVGRHWSWEGGRNHPQQGERECLRHLERPRETLACLEECWARDRGCWLLNEEPPPGHWRHNF